MIAPTMNQTVLDIQTVLKQNKDIRSGKYAIVENRDDYFDQLDQQSNDQFKAMVNMAPMYILYPKIVDGFSGTVFAKKPNVKGVDTQDGALFQNIDMLGNSLDKLSEKIIKEVFENGFCATFNDYSESLSKPFLRFIPSDQFVRYKTTNDKGYPELSQFIYREEVEIDKADDEFDSEIVTEYTVLDLAAQNEESQGLSYRIRVLREDDKGDVELRSTAFPQMDGKNFTYIPMQIHGAEASNFSIKKSPLQDLSDMNISIMQRVVDQVYMLHWTALPTPYVTGVDSTDNVPTTIGPSKAWHIPQSDSKVGMLEFSGNSARAHQDFIDNLKEIMAATGAQILKKEGVSRETATSVLVRTAAQTSLISTIVDNVSDQIEKVVETHLQWSGDQGEGFSYTLNNDFIKVDMEPNAQIALVKSWLDGAISHETLFNKMKEGELIDTNRTFEQEKEGIKKDPPPFFEKRLDSELNTEKEGEGGDDEDLTKGSNLEGGKVPNKLATEQV